MIMELSNPEKNYIEFKEWFRGMTDNQLIATFNSDVGNLGWVSSRGYFHLALREEFEKRKYDYSTIGDKRSLSLKNRVKLVGKKIVFNSNDG